jgi:hypothetical protein
VVLAREVLDGVADRDRLLVLRVGPVGRVRLSRLVAPLRAEHVLDARELQDVAERGRVHEQRGLDEGVAARLAAAHHHAGDAVAAGPRRDGPVRAQHDQAAAELVLDHHLVEHGEPRRAGRGTGGSPTRCPGSGRPARGPSR